MSVSVPVVMVSSTCYDLRQIRTDLAHFIADELGYSPLLSEFPSFPIDPDVDTIENCRRRVERSANILVLIIGGRHGYTDPSSGKSVTNLEYLAARSKGIPIYAFVEKAVLATLPVWENNSSADFSSVVSDSRLFEFVRTVRNQVWMHEFERAEDITRVLRLQFAHLMQEGLDFRQQTRLQVNTLPKNLHGKALRIALEKPQAWEYRLFAQVLSDEVDTYADLSREHRLGLAIGAGEHVTLENAFGWLEARHTDFERLIEAVNIIMGENLQSAFGPPGEPGNAREIVFFARKLGELYRHVLEWSHRVRLTRLPECFRSVATELARYTDDFIDRVEEYGPNILNSIEEALASHQDGVRQEIEMILNLNLSNQEAFLAALRQAQRDCFGI